MPLGVIVPGAWHTLCFIDTFSIDGFVIVFDETTCFARGKNLSDGRHTVSASICGLWSHIEATPLGWSFTPDIEPLQNICDYRKKGTK